MNLVPVDPYVGGHLMLLWRLLSERTPEQSISHKTLPSFTEHADFVRSVPYLYWYVMAVPSAHVGAIYLTRQREIGIAVLRDHQRQGYGRISVKILMHDHPGPFLANINPSNDASIAFWKSLGFTLKQVTYAK